MANRNEDHNQGQQSQEKRTGSQNQDPTQRKGVTSEEQDDVTNEGGAQSGGTRKPDRTNEGEREGNSNDRQGQKGNEEGGMGGNQSGNRGGQNSGTNR